MAIYKIYCSGCVYVAADSPEDAIGVVDSFFHAEFGVDGVEELDVSAVEL